MKKQKLELTWVGKYDRPNLEPRILLEDEELSFHAADLEGITDNRLIYGDNLLALKSLEQEFQGKVKCVYIDPPFNTGQAFPLYEDGLEHSLWLSLIRDRIAILYNLLSNKGIFWIHLDDNEVHYCKVILDEIFGRSNFVSHITYERSGSAGIGQGGTFVNTAEHILLYRKSPEAIFNNVLASTQLEAKTMKRYNKVLQKEGERELVREFTSKSNGLPVKVYKHTGFEIRTISLAKFEQREKEIRTEFVENFTSLFRTNNVQKENKFQNELMSGMDKSHLYTVEYTPSRGKYQNQSTKLYYYNGELFAWLKDTAYVESGDIVKTNKMTDIWVHADIPKADLANEGGVDFPRGKKPEQLLKRVIELSTNEGDIVLDSFAGSGSTAAVAHKLRRQWITIELGEQCHTHVIPRLKNVISGQDSTGVTKAAGWNGGGGFRYFKLAPSLLQQDRWNNWIISKEYNPAMLAEAVCKLMGFRYAPSEEHYWLHGMSSETDFIYVTTQSLSHEQLKAISTDVGDNRTLLVCCKAFITSNADNFENLTVKKIPQSVLRQCEWGQNDYSLDTSSDAPESVESFELED